MSPNVAVRREIVFHHGEASTVREFPAEPRIPAPQPIEFLSTSLGEFPRSSSTDQAGAWLLCDCQESPWHAYRVGRGQPLECGQCDTQSAFLYCDCGIVSRYRASSTEGASCLLCGAKAVQELRHDCRATPEGPVILLTAGTDHCGFCGWPEKIKEARAVGLPKTIVEAGADLYRTMVLRRGKNHRATSSSQEEEKKSKKEVARRAAASGQEPEGSTPLPINQDKKSSRPARVQRSRTLRTFTERQQVVALVVLVILVLVISFGLLLWNSSSGHGPDTPSEEVFDKKRIIVEDFSGPLTSTSVDQVPLEGVEPPDFVTPTREQDPLDASYFIGSLEEAIASGDTRRVRRVIERAQVTSDQEAQLQDRLSEAEQLVQRVESTRDFINENLLRALELWAEIVDRYPSFAQKSSLADALLEEAQAQIRALEREQAWGGMGKLITRLEQAQLGPEFCERARIDLGIGLHRDLLARVRMERPHEAIGELKNSPPPSDPQIIKEHYQLLAELRAEWDRRDKQAPEIRVVGDPRYVRGDPLKIELEIEDDYGVEDVSCGYQKVKSDSAWSSLTAEQEGTILKLQIEAHEHQGKELAIRVVAVDWKGKRTCLQISAVWWRLNDTVKQEECVQDGT